MLQKKTEWDVNSVNPLYLMINRIDGFIEEKNGDKYLNISVTERNKEVLRKYSEVWNGIKDCIKKINDSEVVKYSKYYIEIKSNSNDNISLNKQLNFPTITVIIRNIFEKDGCKKVLLQKFYSMKELILAKGFILTSQICQ